MARPRVHIPTGTQFGKYSVLSESHRHPVSNTMYYLSRCECGSELAVSHSHLLRCRNRGTGCFSCSVAARAKTGAHRKTTTSRRKLFDEYGNLIVAPVRFCRKCGGQLPITRYFNCGDCARHLGYEEEGLC